MIVRNRGDPVRGLIAELPGTNATRANIQYCLAEAAHRFNVDILLLHLVEVLDLIDKLVYDATNPVKDRLIEKVHQWPA